MERIIRILARGPKSARGDLPRAVADQHGTHQKERRRREEREEEREKTEKKKEREENVG
jgi:hypothetical protein